jgi:monofunctional biosynthetic peptidoglycan transglycosylase
MRRAPAKLLLGLACGLTVVIWLVIASADVSLGAKMANNRTRDGDSLIVNLADSAEAERWIVVDDVVMGGRSASEIRFRDGPAVFTGTLSLENNGGFASTRTLPRDFGLEGYTGIRLRVLGDGKRYRFRIRTDGRYDGIAYQLGFVTTQGEWSVIDLPFDQFVASFRGRSLPDAGPLNPAAIQQIGFLVADKQVGRFTLEIDWIKAYR